MSRKAWDYVCRTGSNITIFGAGREPWKSKHGYDGRVGYSRLSAISIFIFNEIVAIFLLLVSMPVFCAVALAIKLSDPGPLFYTSIRMGLHKKLFTMYKFRTLPVGAAEKIGAKLLSPNDFRLSWFSRLLRDTRLDELPQLFNIIKGDMDFIGPRPLRPEIYERFCRAIPDFDKRFSVKPGLIGYSQLCTPHSAPKRIRAIIDNRAILKKRTLWWDIIIILITIFAVIKKVALLLMQGFWKYIIKIKLLRIYQEKRLLDRIAYREAYAVLSNNPTNTPMIKLVDINEMCFRVESTSPIALQYNTDFPVRIYRPIMRRRRRRLKMAKCLGRLFYCYTQERDGSIVKYVYVISYQAVNDYYRYVIDQYFLKKSLLNCF